MPLFSGVLLILNGLLLPVCAHKRRSERRRLKDLNGGQALSVGLFQTFALIPGLSRSGLSMIGGFRLGLSYEEAARFAFLTATPIVGAAGLLELPKLGTAHASGLLGASILGGIAAAVVAFLSTHLRSWAPWTRLGRLTAVTSPT